MFFDQMELLFIFKKFDKISCKMYNHIYSRGQRMKKVKFIKIVNVLVFIVFVLILPTAFIFIPYIKLDAFWYYMIGLVIFCLFSLLFSKQKFYFDVGSDKVQVYATMSKTAIIVNGQVLEDKTHKGQDCEMRHTVGGNEIKIKISRPVVAPNIAITVNGQEPKFTNVKQNVFLKLNNKK